MADQIATSFDFPSYAGMLFNKGNKITPFSTMIGGAPKQTNAVEFICGQEFTVGGGAQPSISETASLTAPYSTAVARTQLTNVTQIFQETVYTSYAKESNMGSLSGANIAGQTPNPVSELDFQIAARMGKIANDIEYTFINGAYVKAANDATANQSRGMNTAITTNIVAADGEALRVWDLANAIKLIYEQNAGIVGLVALLNATSLFQLTADAEMNDLEIVPNGMDINGLAISTIATPFGVTIALQLQPYVPSGTVLIVNPTVCSPVFQPVPGKGNFFLEELSKTGAGTKKQIFGQIGLDHGPEWMHAKITGINTAFVKPLQGKRIYAVDAIPTAASFPVLDTVTLGALTDGVQSSALTLTYVGDLASAATLAYEWQECATQNGTYVAIAGATSATYTPSDKHGKYVRVKVTATVTAKGTVYSNKVLVAAAG